MRVGLALVGAFRDSHRLDALGDDDAWNTFEALEEPFEPKLEIEPVPEDEICFLRLQDVAGRRLIVVNFSVGLGDQLDGRCVPGNVSGHVGNDREGRDGLEFGLSAGRLCHQPKQRRPGNRRKNDAPAPVEHSLALLCRAHATVTHNGLQSSNCNSFATDLTFSELSDSLQMRPIRK